MASQQQTFAEKLLAAYLLFPELSLAACNTNTSPTGLNQILRLDQITSYAQPQNVILNTLSATEISNIVNDSYQDLSSWNILFSGQPFYCPSVPVPAPCNPCNVETLLTYTSPTTMYARSFMVLFGHDSNFVWKTQNQLAVQNSGGVDVITSPPQTRLGLSFIATGTYPGQIHDFSQLLITTSSNYSQFCDNPQIELKKVFALREIYLNSFIQNSVSSYGNPQGSLPTTINFPTSSTTLKINYNIIKYYNPFNSQFSSYSDSNLPATHGFGKNEPCKVRNYGAFYADFSSPVLVTNAFIQFGDYQVTQPNFYYYNAQGAVSPPYPIGCSAIQPFDEFIDFTTAFGGPKVVSKVVVVNKDAWDNPTNQKLQLCSMQNFGWNSCSLVDVQTMGSTYSQSQANPSYVYYQSSTPQNSFMMKFQFSVTSTYDLDQPKYHNEFCSLGFQNVKLSTGTSIKWSYNAMSGPYQYPATVTFDISSIYLTLSIPSTQLDFTTQEVNQLRFTFEDSRQPDPQKELDFFVAQCLCTISTDLSILQFQAQLKGIQTQIVDGFTSFNYDVTSGTNSLTFETTGIPTCQGFQSELTTSQMYTLDDSGLQTLVSTDFFQFQACANTNARICFYWDPNTLTLQYVSSFYESSIYQQQLKIVTKLFACRQKISYENIATFYIHKQPSLLSQVVVTQPITVDFVAVNSQVTIKYQLGLGTQNKKINLLKFYKNLSKSYDYSFVFTAVQITGSKVPTFFIDSNFDFVVQTDDPALKNIQVQYQINASTNLPNQIPNDELILTYYFIQPDINLDLALNTPSYFTNPLSQLQSLPCYDSMQALAWSQTLPTFKDDQFNPVSISISCENQPKNLFVISIYQNTPTITLSKGQNNFVSGESLQCQFDLSDRYNATQSYQFTIPIGCQDKPIPYVKQELKNEFNQQAPNAVIQSIDRDGLVTVSWNVNMKIPDERVNSTRVLNSISTSENNSQGSSLNGCNWEYPFQITLLPGAPQNQRNLNFTYKIFRYKKRQTLIQMYFQTPEYVSEPTSRKDTLQIIFNDTSCFVSETGKEMPAQFKIRKYIPQQNTAGVVQLPQGQIKILVKVLLITAMLSAFSLSSLLSGIINQVLSFVKNLSFITHMFLVSLNYPAQMANFFSLIFPLIVFEAFPAGVLYDKIFDFSSIQTDHSLSEQFENVGYASIFIVNNIGSMYLMMNIWIVMLLLLACLKKSRVFERKNYLNKKIQIHYEANYWNGIIDGVSQIYQVLAVASFIESNDIRINSSYSSTERYNSVLAIILMAITVAFPFILIIVMYFQLKMFGRDSKLRLDTRKKYLEVDFLSDRQITNLIFTTVEYKSFEKQFGTLFQGIRIRELSIPQIILVKVLDLLRQLILAISVTRLTNMPTFCLISFNFLILFHLMFLLYVWPYADKWEQARTIINEVILLILNYHLFLFTDYVDHSGKPFVANSVIYIIWINIGFNLLYVLVTVGSALKHKLRLIKLQRKHRANNRQKQQDVLNIIRQQKEKEIQEQTEKEVQKLQLEYLAEDLQKVRDESQLEFSQLFQNRIINQNRGLVNAEWPMDFISERTEESQDSFSFRPPAIQHLKSDQQSNQLAELLDLQPVSKQTQPRQQKVSHRKISGAQMSRNQFINAKTKIPLFQIPKTIKNIFEQLKMKTQTAEPLKLSFSQNNKQQNQKKQVLQSSQIISSNEIIDQPTNIQSDSVQFVQLQKSLKKDLDIKQEDFIADTNQTNHYQQELNNFESEGSVMPDSSNKITLLQTFQTDGILFDSAKEIITADYYSSSKNQEESKVIKNEQQQLHEPVNQATTKENLQKRTPYKPTILSKLTVEQLKGRFGVKKEQPNLVEQVVKQKFKQEIIVNDNQKAIQTVSSSKKFTLKSPYLIDIKSNSNISIERTTEKKYRQSTVATKQNQIVQQEIYYPMLKPLQINGESKKKIVQSNSLNQVSFFQWSKSKVSKETPEKSHAQQAITLQNQNQQEEEKQQTPLLVDSSNSANLPTSDQNKIVFE